MLQLVSNVFEKEAASKSCFLKLSLLRKELPKNIAKDQILVKVEAAAINPSDLGLMIPLGVDLDKFSNDVDENGNKVLVAPIKVANASDVFKGRLNKELPVGNEGSGTVIDAGETCKHLIGKKVAFFGGAAYSTHRLLKSNECLELLPNTTAADGASCFVNPLTVLGMVHTMRRENFKGIVHTAAASQLGQMLVRLCDKENVPLVNVVRKTEQEELLKSIGAKIVVNSSSPTFKEDLIKAIAESNAYLAFDATGGGKLASDILSSMEAAALRAFPTQFSIYGSNIAKKLYIYGNLDVSPTTINRNFGFNWSLSGWLLFPNFISIISPSELEAAKNRIAEEVKTTFKTSFSNQLTLNELLDIENVKQYYAKETNKKFLVTPHSKL